MTYSVHRLAVKVQKFGLCNEEMFSMRYVKVKIKGKVLPRSGHGGPEGE
jgi:hypothetical protein